MADNRQLALPGPAGTGSAGNFMDRLGFLRGNTDILFAGAIIGILGILIIPVPPFLLDFLLALNITFSILILMVSIYIRSPLDISVFPTILLVTTLFRLGLNIASTRLILGEADAGNIITAFGSFVIGGNYVVGIIIFIILVVINFIVIIKGSGRIAEVAARFTLDALPGKQMSIDADLNAGFIDEKEARTRRDKLSKESEFYGAMDGAAKFVKGDAIAGLIITAINILGGFAIGAFQMGMTITDALSTYTILTIGDGLVSQIPSLLISVAAGLVVTRSASGESLQNEVGTQFTRSPRVLFVSGGALLVFAALPGFPVIPFILLSGAAVATGYMRMKNDEKESEEAMRRDLAEAKAPQQEEEKPVEELLAVDPVEIELGYGLIPLVDESQGGDLFKRISNIRRQLALELGILIPPVRVRDNLQLDSEEYIVKFRGNETARNKLYPGMLLAMNPGTADGELQGMRVTEPVFGLPAVWVPFAERENTEILGYTVVEPEAVLSTHLTELLRLNAHKLLDRQSVKQLLEATKKEYPALVEEATSDSLSTGTLQKVLQSLLREGIPIRDLPLILESLLDYVTVTKNVEVLTEYIRHSLSDTIRRLYQDNNGIIHGISLDPQIEHLFTTSLQNNAQAVSPTLGLSPDILNRLQNSITNAVDEISLSGYAPIIITAATIRPYLYRMIHTTFPSVAVISFTELPSDTEIEFVSHISIE